MSLECHCTFEHGAPFTSLVGMPCGEAHASGHLVIHWNVGRLHSRCDRNSAMVASGFIGWCDIGFMSTRLVFVSNGLCSRNRRPHHRCVGYCSCSSKYSKTFDSITNMSPRPQSVLLLAAACSHLAHSSHCFL